MTLPILLFLYRSRPKDGVVAWTWFTCYGITRTIAEMWRQTDFSWMGLTGGQLYAMPMIVGGIIGIVYCATRPAAAHRGARAHRRVRPVDERRDRGASASAALARSTKS